MPTEQLQRLSHSANNCRQMLFILDRRLSAVRELLEANDVERCRSEIEMICSVLPEIADSIDPARFEEVRH